MRALFDPTFYALKYPDIARTGADPFEHYLNFGWKEGRDPSARFNTLYYTERAMPGEAERNPLEHYVRVGAARGDRADPSDADFLELQTTAIGPHFNLDYYNEQVAPLLSFAKADEAIGHYLTVGRYQDLEPRPGFSNALHLAGHAHLRDAPASPFFHHLWHRARFATDGASEPLADVNDTERLARLREREIVEGILADFVDDKHYLGEYRDYDRALFTPTQHYVRHSFREKRNPNPLFDSKYYVKQHKHLLDGDQPPLLHYALEGRHLGLRTNPVGGELLPKLIAPPDEAWAALTPAAGGPELLTVIMPVYRGYDDTLSSIYAVLAAPQATPYRLLVLDDRGPEPELSAKLAELAARGQFELVVNERNMGFVRTCNRGIALCTGHVVLLNADTEVYGNWLDRLVAHAYKDPRVATVTPLSNNATICSYPRENGNNILALECSARRLDEMASACNAGSSAEIPTGVGFCFFMSRTAINFIGALDEESFGRGYGEENDFCMRAKKAGFVNLVANDIFVRHTGAVSFAEFVSAEYQSGQDALTGKHPDYPSTVFRFVAHDLNRHARRRLDLWRLLDFMKPRAAVFVTHSLGGGIAAHVEHLADRLVDEGVKVVFVQLGTPRDGLFAIVPHERPQLYTPNLHSFDLAKDADLLVDFLGRLCPEFVHVHSLVSADWREAERMMEIVRGLECDVYMTMHDFASICHRYNLVYPDGNYCGQPPTDTCRRCIKDDHFSIGVIDPDFRRERFRDFMASARAVFVPSGDTARRLGAVFPDQRFTIRIHEERFEAAQEARRPPEDGVRRIMIVGAIGPSKGSSVIHALALDAQQRGLPLSYHVVGWTDIPDMLADAGVEETGRFYDDRQLLHLIDEVDPHLCFLPSVWPETYCYAMSRPMSLSIPVVAFNLGAPAERLRAAKTGALLPLEQVRNPQAINDYFLRADLDALWATAASARFAAYGRLTEDYYGIALHRAA